MEDFLKQRWAEKVAAEKQEVSVSNLEKMRGLIHGHEKLENLFEQVIKASLRYCASRDKLATTTRLNDKQAVMDSDRARRLAHNALIDNINILSRAFVKDGVPVRWREELGNDRNAIGDWAIDLVSNLKDEAIEKERNSHEQRTQKLHK